MVVEEARLLLLPDFGIILFRCTQDHQEREEATLPP